MPDLPRQKGFSRPTWTYLIEKVGSNYVGWKHDATQISSNADCAIVLDAILDDKTENVKAIIEFAEGTFTFLTIGINIKDDDLTIRGQGIGVTTLSIAASVGDVNATLFSELKNQSSTLRTLNAVTQGDTVVTAAGNGGEFVVNELVKVISTDQIGTTNRLNGEVHKIESKSGDALTLYSVIEGDQWTSPQIGRLNVMNFNLHFEGFTMEDLRTSAPSLGSSTFLRIRYFQNVTISNCRFVDNIRTVGFFDNCYDVLIHNCIIDRVQSIEIVPTPADIRYGFEIQACHNVSVTDCSFLDFRHGITTSPSPSNGTHLQGWCSHIIVSGNIFQGTDSTAIDSHGGVRDYVVDGNVCIGNSISSDNGMIGMRGEDIVISNNVIKASSEGINIFTTNSRGKIVVSGNEIESYERCINIQDNIGKLIITGNRLTLVDATAATRDANIRIAKDAGNNSMISNNYIDGVDDTADGIIADSPVGMRISDNYFKDCLIGIDIADADGDTDFLDIFDNTFVSCPTNMDISGANPSGSIVGDVFTKYLSADDANSPVNNSTAFVNSEFKFEAEANGVYAGRIVAVYTSGTDADFKWDFTVPSGMTGKNSVEGSNTFVQTSPTSAGSASWSSVTRGVSIWFLFINSTTPGTVTFRYSQLVAQVVDTILQEHSHWRVEKLN